MAMCILLALSGCVRAGFGSPDVGALEPDVGALEPDVGALEARKVVVLGITGGADQEIDRWLTAGRIPTVHWESVPDASELTVSVYEVDGTTQRCSMSVPATGTTQTLTDCPLDEGQVYALSIDGRGSGATFETDPLFELVVATAAPAPPSVIELYSKRTRDESASRTVTPDIRLGVPRTHLVAAAIAGYEVRIEDGGEEPAEDWRLVESTKLFRLEGLSLTNGTRYRARVRAVDSLGRKSTDIVSSEWTVVEVTATPYGGLDLAPASSLPDVTVADGTTVDGDVHTRLAPYSAKTMTVDGRVTWRASGPSALFLRAHTLSLSPGAVIDVSGADGDTDGNGGKGAIGGGGGNQNCGGARGLGGAAGGNGGAGSLGSGGAGTAGVYNGGFLYGNGGVGGGGEAAAPGGRSPPDGGGSGGIGGFAFECGRGHGGGGGGGLAVVFANTITGAGRIWAMGGDGGPVSDAFNGGGGGGGVVWVYARANHADIEAVVAGGKGHPGGTAGRAQLYQLNQDGSLTERLFGDQWTASPGVAHLWLGHETRFPYAIEQLPPIQLTPDVTLDATTNLSGWNHARVSPLSARTLRVEGLVSAKAENQPNALFLRADTIAFAPDAVLRAGGTDAAYSQVPGTAGGHGASGGGGGNQNCGGTVGGNGGVGDDGQVVSIYNPAGLGWGNVFNPVLFPYGKGGAGGSFRDAAIGGAGIQGGGGGGAGSPHISCGSGGGGGGGGGLIVIVARGIDGQGKLEVEGGSAIRRGGGGGGGVIWVALEAYEAGALTPVVGGGRGTLGEDGEPGTARIFQIKPDGGLTERAFDESW